MSSAVTASSILRNALITPSSHYPHPSSPQRLPAIMSKLLEVTASRRGAENEEDSFFVADLAMVKHQISLWQAELPMVRPFYAVKCNGDRRLLKTIADAGLSFDCASRKEIETVLESTGVTGDRIIYANTIKSPSYLRYASKVGVNRMTFDNVDELFKIKQHHPDSRLLLRIATDDSGAACQLSNKFGCPMIESRIRELLKNSKQLKLNVCGVAFHIGSGGGGSDNAYAAAIRDAKQVFDIAKEYDFQFNCLDIGGGFEADTAAFKVAAQQVRHGLHQNVFPGETEIIAEPGRFFAANAFTLCANVIGRRSSPESAKDMLYVSDGVYGNLNCIIYDHQVPVPRLLVDSDVDKNFYDSVASVWGPTCDGIDLIKDNVVFPRKVKSGDWLYFENVGAYTLAAYTTFNGFCHNTEIHYL